LLRRGVLDTALCDKVTACRWFSPGIPVSSTNKTYRHNINEILLKAALNTTKQTLYYYRPRLEVGEGYLKRLMTMPSQMFRPFDWLVLIDCYCEVF
jgi:hypothetical protein